MRGGWILVATLLASDAQALTPVFDPAGTMTIDGGQMQALWHASKVSWPSHVGWTPGNRIYPTPTPVPCSVGSGPPAQAPPAFEPPAGWQPSGGVKLYRIEVDVAQWRADPTFFLRQWYFNSDRQEAINYIHEAFQQFNAQLMVEANARVQITHINFWDAPAGINGTTVETAVAWWTAHPELQRGPVFYFNQNGGGDVASVNTPCDGNVHTYFWWDEFLGYPNHTTTGGFGEQPYISALLHEGGHVFGLQHAGCYDPPVNYCPDTCYSGTRVCPASMQDLSTMSYCGGDAGSIQSYCGYAVRYTTRLERVLRYVAENAWCAQDVGDPPCQGPDTDGDGVPDACDNCPTMANHWQGDWDENGVGDVCEPQPSHTCSDAAPPDGSMPWEVMTPMPLLVWGRRRRHHAA